MEIKKIIKERRCPAATASAASAASTASTASY